MKLPNPEKCADLIKNQAKLTGPPADLNQIVSLWNGLNVSSESLEKEGYLVDLGEQGAEIIVKETDPAVRRSFTIAHEIGHWVLSRDYNVTPEKVKKERSRANLERWCDRFAAALLMPREWIVSDLRKAKRSELLSYILRLPFIYEVSHRALRLRISELSPVSIYLAAKKEERLFIEEHYESKGVSKGLVAKALHNTKKQLSHKEMNNQFLDTETNLFCIYKTILKNKNAHKWLICIFPEI